MSRPQFRFGRERLESGSLRVGIDPLAGEILSSANQAKVARYIAVCGDVVTIVYLAKLCGVASIFPRAAGAAHPFA